MLADATLQAIVWTARLTEAERFYSEVLGLRLTGRSHGALVYQVGGSDLRVSPVPSTTPSEHTVLGFEVPALAPVIAALAARGVALERFPNLPQDASGVLVTRDGTQVAWFRDPDGNLLSVVQYGQPAG